MATEAYLAMWPEEFGALEHPSAKPGWLDCHFSSDGPGLAGLPSALPSGSLLILTDRFPFRDHDSALIAEQLCQTVSSLNCAGILLDFEKQEQKELTMLANLLVSALPCPVAVSETYARNMDCPVFLSPCPHHIPLSEHLAPWTGRRIWLDLARDAEWITVTPSGSNISPVPWTDVSCTEHWDKRLCCHYHIEITENRVRFMLRRTAADLALLFSEAKNLGIQSCVGLYQEWI